MKKAAITYLGDSNLLLECPSVEVRDQYFLELTSTYPQLKIRRGMESILLCWPRPLDNPEAMCAEILNSLPESTHSDTTIFEPTIEIPVVYDGMDLTEVTTRIDLSIESFVTLHTRILWRVDLIGFSPGLPYLSPVTANPDLQRFETIARRDSPRTKVPAGSIGIAGGLTIIYPTPMPGGWHIIGSTKTRMFNSSKTSPATLSIGDIVKFTAL